MTDNAVLKAQVNETLWLLFFNKYLYEKGLITESEHNRMKVHIQASKMAASIR